MDDNLKTAVDMEIKKIEETYGRNGLILAMDLLKKILDNL